MEAINKRQKSGPKNLCVICWCDDDFNVYIVDVNDGGGGGGGGGEVYVKRRPNLVLRGFDPGSYFCVLGSTLYIFGCDGDRPVYEYSLDYEQFDVQLEMSSMTPSPAGMPSQKFSPAAIPTPDGKILAFSSVINFAEADEKEIEHNFGLFDPIVGLWENLPEIWIHPKGKADEFTYIFEMTSAGVWQQLPIQKPYFRGSINYSYGSLNGKTFEICDACFTTKHCLVVRAVSQFFGLAGYCLMLDLQSLNKGWQIYQGWNWIPRINSHSNAVSLVVEDRVFLNTNGGYFRTTESGRSVVRSLVCSSPLSSFEFPVAFMGRRGMAVSDYIKDKECRFCIINTGTHRRSTYLTVDVLKCDLCSPSQLTLKTSYKFHVEERETTEFFLVSSVFMLPPIPFPPFKEEGESLFVE